MTRDTHWLFPTHAGGRVDVYVKSASAPHYATVTKACTSTGAISGHAAFTVALGKNDAPGFYDIVRVAPSAGQSIATTSTAWEAGNIDTRGYDATADSGDNFRVPALASAGEAEYSYFQTSAVTFQDNQISSGNTTNYNFDITLRTMPLIKEIQEFLAHPDILDPGGDVLVKAAVPCWLTLSFSLVKTDSSIAVDTSAVKGAICNYIGSLGFVGSIYLSQISAVIQSALPAGVSASALTISGAIRAPDGTAYSATVTSNSVSIPDEHVKYVSANTTVFLIDSSLITIS